MPGMPSLGVYMVYKGVHTPLCLPSDPFHCWSCPKLRPLLASQNGEKGVTFRRKEENKDGFITVLFLSEHSVLNSPDAGNTTRFTVGG